MDLSPTLTLLIMNEISTVSTKRLCDRFCDSVFEVCQKVTVGKFESFYEMS